MIGNHGISALGSPLSAVCLAEWFPAISIYKMSIGAGFPPQTRSYAPAAYIHSRSASELLHIHAKDRASSPHDGLLLESPTPML